MRIRRNASRLLGCAVSAPPRFELPPPSGFELPPPANETHAGFAYTTPSSSPEIYTLSVSPWDLMDELDLSDPKEEERFMETYSVHVVSASSIDNNAEEDMSVDMVNGTIPELHLAEKKNAARKKESKLKTKKGEAKGERYVAPEEEEHESWRGKAVVKKSDAVGRAPVYLCNKIVGKGCFCRRRVRRPDSFCWYHSGQKIAASSSSKPRRKRAAANADQECTKRHRRSGSSMLEEPPLPPAEQRQEAAVQLPGEHMDVQLPEEHVGFTAGQAQDDGANHQIAPARVDNEPRHDYAGGSAPVYLCNKNVGKGLFYRRRVRRPDSFCWYHSDQKTAASSSSKPRRKRTAADANEGFYYYAGFGQSSSTTKHRSKSSSSVPEEPPLPAEQKHEAVAVQLLGEHTDIEVKLPEEHTGFTANHQMAPACVDNEPERDDGDMAGIAGCDEEISSDDDDTLGCKGELSRDVKRRKSPLKKRKRKPVKARSVNALM